jgi:probable F420-dependent oxidoreductase
MGQVFAMKIELSRIGLSTPGVTAMPGAASDWEFSASFTDIASTVSAADRLGYHHVTCSEHIGVPSDQAERRGARYYDPLATFGYFAAVTSHIRFVTSVLVLGYHHPLEIAKRYGTLDVVCGGRLILGLGIGTLKEEFDLLGIGGVEFKERGARGDDALRALRVSLGKPFPEYHGPFYDYGGLNIDPCAVQQHMPFWIGGRTFLSLRRAVLLAEGWTPFGLSPDEMAAIISRAKDMPEWDGRPTPLEIVMPGPAAVDPIDEPAHAVELIGGLFAAGATKAALRVKARSAGHFIEQIEALATLEL